MKGLVTILGLVLISFTAHAQSGQSKIQGLNCDQTEDGRDFPNRKITLDTLGGGLVRLGFYDLSSEKPGAMKVPYAQIAPILRDNLAAMNKVTISDASTGTSISFLASGQEFNGKTRLKVLITFSKAKLVYNNCTPSLKVTGSF